MVIKNQERINRNNDKFIEIIIISQDQENIIEIIEKFRKTEVLIKDIEILVNKFISEINLECNFLLMFNDGNNNFSIQIQFLRSNKEMVDFNGLTTPEKVFFIMTFYISIQIQLDTKNITFSNLFIQSMYNKRGSIFRTIRKILPLFEKEIMFKNFNLIFILSNLEMKDQIKNLKIINIEEKSEKNGKKRE